MTRALSLPSRPPRGVPSQQHLLPNALLCAGLPAALWFWEMEMLSPWPGGTLGGMGQGSSECLEMRTELTGHSGRRERSAPRGLTWARRGQGREAL